MKYAIISDIHSNLAALEQVLEYIHNEKCDSTICLGDIVGYGPHPNECIQLVRDYTDIVIAGNHDYAAAGLTNMDYFNVYAKKAMDWTIANLKDEYMEYLRSLPLAAEIDQAHLVHAAPMSPEKWGYIFTPYQAQLNFEHFSERCCFIGHSHLPIIFQNNDNEEPVTIYDTKLELEKDKRYIINVGSVGQPRDHQPTAAFGILDTDNAFFHIVRVEYDVYTTQKAMMARDFPEFLIERLKHGR